MTKMSACLIHGKRDWRQRATATGHTQKHCTRSQENNDSVTQLCHWVEQCNYTCSGTVMTVTRYKHLRDGTKEQWQHCRSAEYRMTMIQQFLSMECTDNITCQWTTVSTAIWNYAATCVATQPRQKHRHISQTSPKKSKNEDWPT